MIIENQTKIWYKFHAGQETGAYVGAGKIGGGVFAKFKKQGEEE